ncbi:MAG: hypothetical protein K2X32_12525, partial [Phycisphaerales bacterium]|nr:hypothetical protein [Phycisphaerales bacterium]
MIFSRRTSNLARTLLTGLALLVVVGTTATVHAQPGGGGGGGRARFGMMGGGMGGEMQAVSTQDLERYAKLLNAT